MSGCFFLKHSVYITTWSYIGLFANKKSQAILQNSHSSGPVLNSCTISEILLLIFQKLKRSRDSDHAHFRDGLSSVGWDLLSTQSNLVNMLIVVSGSPWMAAAKALAAGLTS